MEGESHQQRENVAARWNVQCCSYDEGTPLSSRLRPFIIHSYCNCRLDPALATGLIQGLLESELGLVTSEGVGAQTCLEQHWQLQLRAPLDLPSHCSCALSHPMIPRFPAIMTEWSRRLSPR